MVNKDAFLNQIKTFDIDSSTYDKLIDLYELYDLQQLGGNISLGSAVDITLSALFKGALDDFSIPASFINSPVGHVIFSLKFGSKKELSFTPKEVALLISKTKALISHDIKDTKKLNATRHGNGKSLIISESDLVSYMKDKGFSEIESYNRIDLFIKLKSENMKMDDIKEQLDKLQSKV
jgi:hypothetical protein